MTVNNFMVTLCVTWTAWGVAVAFVIDSSHKPDSGIYSWPSILNFVIAVSNYSAPQWTGDVNQFALVRYSDEAQLLINFTQSTDSTSFQHAVCTTAYSPGNGSNLVAAIDFVRTRVFINDGIQSNRWEIAVIITDNLPSTANTSALQSAVYAAKTEGILLFIVGINASGVDRSLVAQICSYSYHEQGNLMAFATDYRNLVDIVSFVGKSLFMQQLWGSPNGGNGILHHWITTAS